MNVLTIAGSDPSSGAGIQGDIKTFAALGVYGFSVVTALTSQNSSKFFKSEPASPEIIKSQIRAIRSDFKIGAVKIGMVYDRNTIRVIHAELKNIKAPVILDPIFQSTTGGELLQEDAFPDFKKLLIPISYVITPNVPEAEKITGMKIRTMNDVKKAAQKIKSMGAKNVIIKGGHMKDSNVTDLLLENKKFHVFSQKRLARESHGGGCIFSASLCANIAKGKSVSEAAGLAQNISYESIKEASRVGMGLSIARQKNTDEIESELSRAIASLVAIKKIHKFIPEVQTNFVYSKPKPRSISDILGIEGRIVKAGDMVLVAGALKYGGSKHIANAVLQVSTKFPVIRSAVNIRYDKRTIAKAISKKMNVSFYDRMLESSSTKNTEGRSISWGIGTAIASLRSPPDITYHTGDVGKEPMIIVFGKNPMDVLAKLARLGIE